MSIVLTGYSPYTAHTLVLPHSQQLMIFHITKPLLGLLTSQDNSLTLQSYILLMYSQQQHHAAACFLHSDHSHITNTFSHTQGINPSLIFSLNNINKDKYKTIEMSIRINNSRLQQLLLPRSHITFKV
jgi:hypothetical protein